MLEKVRFWQSCSALLVVAGLFTNQSVGAEPTPNTRGAQLELLYKTIQSELGKVSGVDSWIEKAYKKEMAGDRVGSQAALRSYFHAVGANPDRIAEEKAFPSRKVWMKQLIEVSPKAVADQFGKVTLYLGLFLEQVNQAEKNNRDTLAHLSPLRNRAIEESIVEVRSALEELYRDLKYGDINTKKRLLFEVSNHRSILMMSLTGYYEALLNRFGSVSTRAKGIGYLVDAMRGLRSYDASNDILFDAIEAEKNETVLRIYVNRKTISTTALAVALIAEVITIPFTLGASATTIPPTLAAITSGLTVASNGVWVVTGALNISDRLLVQGAKGLLTLDTLFDVMMIVGGLPTGGKVMALNNKYIRWFKQFQKANAYTFFGARTVFKIWQIYNAAEVAKNEKYETLPFDEKYFQREGITSIAAYIFFAGKMALSKK